MDDSFSFRTTVPLRRQLDPRAVRAGAFLAIVALGIGLFANWVVASERRSFVRADRRDTASEIAVTQIHAPRPVGSDADAKEAARIALVAARAAFTEHQSFLDADPAHLAALQPGYTYVDGPSTMPRIVSVASTTRSWAAAVRGSSGACFWVRIGGAGTTYGTGSDCTGGAALEASERGW